MKRNGKITSLILSLMTVSLFLTSCMASSSYSKGATDDYYPTDGNGYYDIIEMETPSIGMDNDDYSNKYESMSAGTPPQSSAADTRKIVRTVDLTMETLNFDDAIAKITSAAASYGGYLEYSYVSGESIRSNGDARYASFTVRIPADQLDNFVNGFDASFNILNKTENSTDITDTYYDTQARLNSLLTQEERLLAMLEGATELQYMLEIENTLANVRYQIESYYSTINRYDKQIALSTVSISLQEVIEYQPIVVKPKTFGERLSQAFSESWKDFADGWKNFMVGFVYVLPGLITLAVLAGLIILIVVMSVKAARKKRRSASAVSPHILSDNEKNHD